MSTVDESGLVACTVVGELPIVDAVTRASIGMGGTVRLDPQRTNIAALVDGGAVEVPPARPAKAEKPAKG